MWIKLARPTKRRDSGMFHCETPRTRETSIGTAWRAIRPMRLGVRKKTTQRYCVIRRRRRSPRAVCCQESEIVPIPFRPQRVLAEARSTTVLTAFQQRLYFPFDIDCRLLGGFLAARNEIHLLVPEILE